MRNFKNNRRKFIRNSFDRNSKINGNHQQLNSSLGNLSDFRGKKYFKNNINLSKLIQKYTDLAREVLSSGDKILYENYMQHAEHFIRLSESSTNASNEKDTPTKVINQININKISEEDSKDEDGLKIREN